MNEDLNQNDDNGNNNEVKLTEEETRAINLGWKPKDQWQGSPDEWVPAKWWLKYGDVEQRLLAAEQENKHKEKVLGSMKSHYTRVKEDAMAEVKQTIQRQKREALKNEDYQRVAELDAELEVLEGGLKNKFANVDKQVNEDTKQSGPPPEFFEWQRHNPWYKPGTNDEVTGEADALALAYVARNPNSDYKTMLNHVTDRIKKVFPDKFKAEEPPMTGVDEGGEQGSKPTKGGSKSPKLTEVEKEVAARFGMTEEEYAKERDSYNKRKGI